MSFNDTSRYCRTVVSDGSTTAATSVLIGTAALFAFLPGKKRLRRFGGHI